MQDLRAIFSIERLYLILIGLENHAQFEVKDEKPFFQKESFTKEIIYLLYYEKAIEDSAFDDIIHLTFDNEEAHHFLSGILERRLNWLNLNELFDESGKEETVKSAKGSPRELIKYLNMRNYFS